MKVLLTWLGTTDLRASEGDAAAAPGPLLSATRSILFDAVLILSSHSPAVSKRYAQWLGKLCQGQVFIEQVTLRSPTDFEDVSRAAVGGINRIRTQFPAAGLTYHLSPGTPTMAAIWVLLSKTRFPAELIESSREGGVRVVSIPFDVAAEYQPTGVADRALERLSEALPPPSPSFSTIVHRCQAMKRVVSRAGRLGNRDVPVLIQGESGTGKELFARAIHQASSRAAKPFVALNCGAIPGDLVDSVLFGHEKGAFTGAISDTAGQFEASEGGTLFLDEIGELPLASQVRLLRVLQERQVTRVGAVKARKVDARVIAATNRVLTIEVQQGRFREDLFHRLAVGVLVLPPLREREGDIGILLDSLLARINADARGQPGFVQKSLSVGARNLLLQQAWPGNIREMHNTVLRASIWSDGPEITKADVMDALEVGLPPKGQNILGRPLGASLDLQGIMADVARHYLKRAMQEVGGNKTKAAALVGLPSYQTLRNWLQKYGLE